MCFDDICLYRTVPKCFSRVWMKSVAYLIKCTCFIILEAELDYVVIVSHATVRRVSILAHKKHSTDCTYVKRPIEYGTYSYLIVQRQAKNAL
jgi:hypothetical protein